MLKYLLIRHCKRKGLINLLFIFPACQDTLATGDDHEDNTDNREDHEDDEGSVAKLHKEIDIIFIT